MALSSVKEPLSKGLSEVGGCVVVLSQPDDARSQVRLSRLTSVLYKSSWRAITSEACRCRK